MSRKMFLSVCTLALAVGLAFAPVAKASDSGLMEITTTNAVQIPGAVLQPGTYSFRLVPSNNEVTVSTADGLHRYGTFFVVPTYRGEVTNDSAVSVEQGVGGMDRIAAWYFPGDHSGYAFLYPKAKKLTSVAKSMGK